MLINAGYQLNDVPHRSNWYKFGGTAIKMAAENGFADIVRLMLDHGADPDIPGWLHWTFTKHLASSFYFPHPKIIEQKKKLEKKLKKFSSF
jgi:ankyrin repeat protein